jgi:hypothetical protein
VALGSKIVNEKRLGDREEVEIFGSEVIEVRGVFLLTFSVLGILTVNVWFGWSPSTKQLRQRSWVKSDSEGIPTSNFHAVHQHDSHPCSFETFLVQFPWCGPSYLNTRTGIVMPSFLMSTRNLEIRASSLVSSQSWMIARPVVHGPVSKSGSHVILLTSAGFDARRR